MNNKVLHLSVSNFSPDVLLLETDHVATFKEQISGEKKEFFHFQILTTLRNLMYKFPIY